MKDPNADPPRASRPGDRSGSRPLRETDERPEDPSADPSSQLAGASSGAVDLSGLSIAGLSRRRVGWVVAGLLAAWIVVVFARQVSDATAATNRAAQMAADNAALAGEVAALQREVALIVEPEFVEQQARAHGFGGPREIAFTLDPSVPAPVDGAPGSASVRLGAIDDRQTPLEAWLSLLFGPGT